MIVFRVDANEQVATGHLMRCLAIASECRRRGADCLFVLADAQETGRIRGQGFPCCILGGRWDRMEEELEQLQALLGNYDCDWLVVDSYQATPSYLQHLHQQYRVLYLEDFGTLGYEVTAVLHYGLIEQQEDYIRHYSGRGIRVLAGTEYIPLREEFQPLHLEELRGQRLKDQETPHGQRIKDRETLHKPRTDSPPAILITTGGTDPCHVAVRVLEQCLRQDLLCRCRYHVVTGSMYHQTEALERLAENGSSDIRIHHAVDRMADLMCQCDYAVSAGGTTLYELCACGVPTVCFSFVDNQLPAVTQLHRNRVMRYAGDAREGNIQTAVCHALEEYIRHPEETAGYRTRMRKLVDGRGVFRIADLLCR